MQFITKYLLWYLMDLKYMTQLLGVSVYFCEFQVINKFFQIRQHSVKEFEDTSWDEKCACLLGDPEEVWSFNDASTSKYIVRFRKPWYSLSLIIR